MAGKAAKKTHAVRLLETKGIAHRVTVYDDSGEFHSGEEAAALVGATAETVYKTLVVLRDPPSGKPMLVMVPVAEQADLKALAASLGEKRLRMATQREAERLTGLQVGGISAMALQKPGFDILIDERAILLEKVHISAGARGIDVELAVEDLVALTDARYVKAI
ncbi:MAG TPA: YbaK/EbsC family protein [Dehalococcoidia bacterium]|nr:YbaK/EbsC family protein [Dehalococcoidia bacterium]